MTSRHAPLYLGAEDTLTIGTAVAAYRGMRPPRPTLADYCAHVDKLVEQGLGNLYVVRGYMLSPDADPEMFLESKKCVIDDPDGDLVRLFEYAAQRGVYTMTIYTRVTAPVVAALRRRCGRFYLGSNLGEVTSAHPPTGAGDMGAATRSYVSRLAQGVRNAWRAGQPHVTCTGTNFFIKYCLEAGMDIPTAEIFTCPSVDVQWSLVRGGARGYGLPMFGGWMATGWFTRSNRDPLKPLLCTLGLASGYLHGAGMMVQESGHWGLYEFGELEGEDHSLCRAYRRNQKRFAEFAERNPRPKRGPDVRIGLVQGRFDGYNGIEGDVWGQPGWNLGPHEKAWDLLKVFYPAVGRAGSMLEQRDRRHARFSGTPYGLVDIVPAETPAERLRQYGTLLFLGWNTMDAAQYRALTEYVRQGGRLVMWASHLNASTKREDAGRRFRFYRRGDLRDLFGARVRVIPQAKTRGFTWRPPEEYVNTIQWVRAGRVGFPKDKRYWINWPQGGVESRLEPGVRVLAVTDRGKPFVTEHRLGKGVAVLVHTHTPQGSEDFREFAEDLYHAVGQRELPSFRVEGNPKLSYAVYGRGRRRTMYVLNTNLERSETASVVGLSAGPRRVRLKPAEIARIDWE